MAPLFWALPVLNVLAPLVFLYRPARRNLVSLFIVSILVNIGMWLERMVIIAGSLSHDFLPHNWLHVLPQLGGDRHHARLVLLLPVLVLRLHQAGAHVSMPDVKEDLTEGAAAILRTRHRAPLPPRTVREAGGGVLARLSRAGRTCWRRSAQARAAALRRGWKPIRPSGCAKRSRSWDAARVPSGGWTLIGAVCGCIGGFWLAIGTALVNGLIVGGKHPVSIIPYCIVGFEGTILLGGLANLIAVLSYARLGTRSRLPRGVRRAVRPGPLRTVRGMRAAPGRTARALLNAAGAEEVSCHPVLTMSTGRASLGRCRTAALRGARPGAIAWLAVRVLGAARAGSPARRSGTRSGLAGAAGEFHLLHSARRRPWSCGRRR